MGALVFTNSRAHIATWEKNLLVLHETTKYNLNGEKIKSFYFRNDAMGSFENHVREN